MLVFLSLGCGFNGASAKRKALLTIGKQGW
jgi:hypothetical protein